MPMIIVRYVTPEPCPELRRPIAELMVRLSAEKLGKDPKVAAVLVEPANPASWFIAGQQPTEAGLSAFWLEITITAGTNTKAETTAFIKAVYQGMASLLGPLHEESYVYVRAADGDAYGFGGRTQNGRWAAAHPD